MTNCYNLWKITAWHDNGYAVDLGYYEGYLDYLAFRLSKDYFQYLYFEPITIQSIDSSDTELAKYANISIPFPVGDPDLLTCVRTILERRSEVSEVSSSDDPRYVVIRRRLTSKEKADQELQEILNKYSDEDKHRLLELLREKYGQI